MRWMKGLKKYEWCGICIACKVIRYFSAKYNIDLLKRGVRRRNWNGKKANGYLNMSCDTKQNKKVWPIRLKKWRKKNKGNLQSVTNAQGGSDVMMLKKDRKKAKKRREKINGIFLAWTWQKNMLCIYDN